jgi:hypothetical protein
MSIMRACDLSPFELSSLGNNLAAAVAYDRRARPRDFRHPRSARRPRWAWRRRKAAQA